MQADLYCDDGLRDDFLSQITIYPAIKAENYSQGLCNEWSRDELNLDDAPSTRSQLKSRQEVNNFILKNRYVMIVLKIQ